MQGICTTLTSLCQQQTHLTKTRISKSPNFIKVLPVIPTNNFSGCIGKKAERKQDLVMAAKDLMHQGEIKTSKSKEGKGIKGWGTTGQQYF